MRCSICHTKLIPNGKSKQDNRPVYADCPHKGKPWHIHKFNFLKDKIPKDKE